MLFRSTENLTFLDRIHYPAITIEEGAFTFIEGPSGCGKSTYLRLLNHTLLPQTGEIYFKGEDVRTLPVLDYRRRVMLIPQEVFLFEASIRQNFAQFYEACDLPCPKEEEMVRFLHLCCADFDLDKDCRALSGGERGRVFLAIYLSRGAEVVLLDEPTAALDAATAFALMTNLKAYCKEKGISVVCMASFGALYFGQRTLYDKDTQML